MRLIERPIRYQRAITARLSPKQIQGLVTLAQQQQRPVSELLREAVDRLLAGNLFVAEATR
jgi:hypothetical protein